MVKDLLFSWSVFPVRKNVRKLWMVAPLSLLWEIWKKKNKIVFEDAKFPYNRLKLFFVNSLTSWAGLISNMDLSIVRVPLCIL